MCLPGEIVPLQDHAGRPGMMYVLEGVIVDHRDDLDRAVPLRTGEFTFNTNGVRRWLENTSAKKVRLFEVDFRDTSRTQR